ncbi:MAG: NUDIX hydrolase [Ilumatobacteraceae bacterium]
MNGRRPGGSQSIPIPPSSRPAGDPLWREHDADFSLTAVLDALRAGTSLAKQPRPDEKVSAVLMLLADSDDGAEILLTRRSTNLSNHRGEISFPGGRVDAGESIIEAARRETHEEVGVHPDVVEVHGTLSPLSTFVSRSYIVPVVGSVVERPSLTISNDEVERAFWVPLRELTRPDTFSWEWWSVPAADDGERPMFFFHLDDETVWGATARILHEMLCRVHGVNHLDLPNW